MQGDKGGGTGYPGKNKGVGGGASQAYVTWAADNAAAIKIGAHESHADPHPQYTTDAEVLALIPEKRFVTYWKWS